MNLVSFKITGPLLLWGGTGTEGGTGEMVKRKLERGRGREKRFFLGIKAAASPRGPHPNLETHVRFTISRQRVAARQTQTCCIEHSRVQMHPRGDITAVHPQQFNKS